MVYLNKDYNVGVGAGYIASTIQQQGHFLTFFDTTYISLEDIILNLSTNEYDFLLISANTMFYKDAVKLAVEAKRVNKNIKILLGGIHATILKGGILENCSYIDYICIGEGEEFVVDFLNKYNTPALHTIQNLGYRDESGVIRINSVRACTDLNKLPLFKWDLFPVPSIVNPGPLPGFCYVFATRGCPYNCTYCCNSFWLDLYKSSYLRKRDINKVISELLYLKNTYPVHTFYFADEMILFDMQYTTELLHRVKKEIQLPYGCMARVEKITPEVVNLFSETGCRYVGMGIECGDEIFRKTFLNRHMSNEQIICAFTELRKVPGLKIASYNMKGYPVDYDCELTKKTLALNDLIKPDFMGMSIFYPFPGTKLYDYCVQNDKIDYKKLVTITNYYIESVLKNCNITGS